MQAGPVQLQAGLNEGLLKTYQVKQHVFKNIKYKRSQNTNYNLHLRYKTYVTLQSILHQVYALSHITRAVLFTVIKLISYIHFLSRYKADSISNDIRG